MVNARLKRAKMPTLPHSGPTICRGKSGVFSVNQFLSKRFEFSENFRRIRFECAQNREPALQFRLVACVKRRSDNSRVARSPRKDEIGTRDVMFFLLRVAFWLTIVLALLPTGGTQNGAQAKVDAADAVVAAGAAVSDMSNFCDRQRDACEVGTQTAVAIGQRAQAGAKMVYDFINDRALHGGNEFGARTETNSSNNFAAVRTIPMLRGSQNTLKPTDVEPSWQSPPIRSENVPLPRPRPNLEGHRKV
jgi:hypothetical protein